jgi:histidinol-phosphate phosphatase family protein
MENSFHTQLHPDKGWTLFLDRDGVINEEIVGSYITSTEEFRFCDGALEALNVLGSIFGTIVVVTNQRGVGRGIMSMETLRNINSNMSVAVKDAGGRIDKIYSCTAVNDEDHNRKPNTGMAIQAREDFPEIDFRKSIMVGNSISDMEFGKRQAMNTVFLTTKHEPFELPNDLIDQQYPSLLSWANALKEAHEMVG